MRSPFTSFLCRLLEPLALPDHLHPGVKNQVLMPTVTADVCPGSQACHNHDQALRLTNNDAGGQHLRQRGRLDTMDSTVSDSGIPSTAEAKLDASSSLTK